MIKTRYVVYIHNFKITLLKTVYIYTEKNVGYRIEFFSPNKNMFLEFLCSLQVLEGREITKFIF